MLTEKNVKFITEPYMGFFDVDPDEPYITVRMDDPLIVARAIGISFTHLFDAITAHTEYNVSDGSAKIHVDIGWKDGGKYDGQNYIYTPTDSEKIMLIEQIEKYVCSKCGKNSCAEVIAADRQTEEEESSVCGIDFNASCPWRAPGMSVDDFI